MSGNWNARNFDRQHHFSHAGCGMYSNPRFQQQHVDSRYQFGEYSHYNNRPEFPEDRRPFNYNKFIEDRSRSTERQSHFMSGPIIGNSSSNNYGYRGRRSRSAPRPNRDFVKNRFVNQVQKDECKDKTDSEKKSLVSKFRKIFGPDAKVENRNDRVSINSDSNVKSVSDEHFNDDRNTKNTTIADCVKDDVTVFYGDSLKALDEDLNGFQINVPVVNWPKQSFNIDNVPDYNPDFCVGGDGLTLEVFYLCKYCKMFTAGLQIMNHLKSKYHYDRYKQYLKTGEIMSSSSDSSESESEVSSKQSRSVENNTSNVIEEKSNFSKSSQKDPDSDVLYCHEELDYD